MRALGFENTDSNCLLRMVACWVGSVYVDPSDFKVLPVGLPYFFLNEGFEFRQFAFEFIIVLFSF